MLVVTSRQPVLDTARRRLLDCGHDPDNRISIRHAGKGYDSFVPRPLAELAN